LSFICGVERPEDLARIAGTRWLIASGFSAGAGLKLIDIDVHTMQFWFTPRKHRGLLCRFHE
jgi:hypothetical protein